jgi:hypothetical protein
MFAYILYATCHHRISVGAIVNLGGTNFTGSLRLARVAAEALSVASGFTEMIPIESIGPIPVPRLIQLTALIEQRE